MRARKAKACAVLPRIVSALSCSRSTSLNTSSAFGLPLITVPALTALLGGQVDLLCDQTTATLPHIQADRVKLFGVTTPARIKALPNVPTLQEGGLKGFDVKVWHGIYAPKGTPPAAVARLTRALQKGLQDPMVVKKLDSLGAQIVPVDKQTPEGLRTMLKAESDKWQPLLKTMKVEVD